MIAKRWRQWSIATRLIVLFTAATCLLMLGTFALIYGALVRHNREEDLAFMRSYIAVMRSDLMEEFPGTAQLQREVESFQTGVGTTALLVRIINAEGRTLAATHGMDQLLPSDLFGRPVGLPDESRPAQRYLATNGREYFLMTAWLGPANESGERWLLQLATDRYEKQLFLRRFRRTLILLMICGMGAIALASRWIVHRGLLPLGEVATAMKRVRPSRLDERISSPGWPSELTGLAAAYDDMLDRLEDSFTRLSRFSADLAHELRTPLAILRGETEVILSKSRTAEEYREVLESSLEEIHRLSQVIDSLLFLARAENAAIPIERHELDAGRELTAVMEFYDAAAAEAEVSISVEGGGLLLADPLLFRRAVSNLVTNALQHTPRGGHIGLLIEAGGGETLISVVDSGRGIAREHLPRLFDRFYRVDPSRHQIGNGLGLSIVRSIMQLHGGKVSIESRPGEGTRVTLAFPAG